MISGIIKKSPVSIASAIIAFGYYKFVKALMERKRVLGTYSSSRRDVLLYVVPLLFTNLVVPILGFIPIIKPFIKYIVVGVAVGYGNGIYKEILGFEDTRKEIGVTNDIPVLLSFMLRLVCALGSIVVLTPGVAIIEIIEFIYNKIS